MKTMMEVTEGCRRFGARKNACKCPVALAAMRALAAYYRVPFYVCVLPYGGEVRDESGRGWRAWRGWDGMSAESPWYLEARELGVVTETKLIGQLPPIAVQFIKEWDKGRPIEEFSDFAFEIEMELRSI